MEPKQIDLYEFLVESELQQYYNSIKNELKISNASHLKYATDEDLKQIGLSRPEIRRLRKFYEKYYPHGYLSKIKRLLQNPTNKKEDGFVSNQNIQDNELTKTTNSPSKTPSNKHIIPADSICVNKQLGTGEFGIVQQGVWTNGTERIQVAIKCLCRERMQSNPMEFLKEAAIMHSIEHENIVRLYGVVLDTDSLMLVTELAHLRSLLECLKDSGLRVNFLTVPTLCEFAQQICNGMMYLENKRLIHRDLAARNILVFSKNKVKISDFGLSRALGVGKDYYKTNFNVNLKLPIAWCAPECINYLRFTNASDVWAYGVCLWEMFSYGFQPWAALTGLQILDAIDEPNYQRLEQPECCPREYYSLMSKCWQHDPSKRPKFNEIYQMLPDMKPEQLKTIGSNCEPNKDHLLYRHGEIITVLDKVTHAPYWKGILNSGKTGLFNPANTVAYLEGLPGSTNRESFCRINDRSSKRKLRTEMISSPQNDLKHTGHVGLDGAFFGDVAFIATNYNRLPRQIVTPYKPFEDIEQTPLLLPPTPTSPDSLQTASGYFSEDLTTTSSTNPTFVNSNENTPKHYQTNSFNSTFDFPPTSKSSTMYNSLNPFMSEAQSSNSANSSKNHNYDLEANAFTNANLVDDDTLTQDNVIKNIGLKWSENEISTITTNTVTTTLSSSNEASHHEYHEISDDEITAEKVFDLGPSLLDEINLMFGSITTTATTNTGIAGNSSSEFNSELKSPDFDHHTNNKKNEISELTSKLNRKNNGNDTNSSNKSGKKNKTQSGSGTVKMISVKDEKILNQAIEIANEISARSMTDLVNDHPTVTQSPKRKFSFRFPNLSHHSSIEKEGHHQNSNLNSNPANTGNTKERKNFSEELRNIPDLQSSITEEHREAYNSLIERKTSSSVIAGKLDTNEFKLTSAKTLPRTFISNSSTSEILPSTVFNQQPLSSASSSLLSPKSHQNDKVKNNIDDPSASASAQSASRPTTLPSRRINKIKKNNINVESNLLRILRDKNHPIIRTRQKLSLNGENIRSDGGDNENINPKKMINNKNDKDTLCESQSYLTNISNPDLYPDNISKTGGVTRVQTTPSPSPSPSPTLINKNVTKQATSIENCNPIPLPPRDRNKIMQTNAKRHVRKHPLIIPAYGVQRTLNKVNEIVPVNDQQRLIFSSATNSTTVPTFTTSNSSESQVDKNLNHLSLDKYSAHTIKIHESENSDNSSIKITKILHNTDNTMNNSSSQLPSTSVMSKTNQNQINIKLKEDFSDTIDGKYKNDKNDMNLMKDSYNRRAYENISYLRGNPIDEQSNTDSASLHFELILEDGFDNVDTVSSPDASDSLCPFAIQKENYNKQKQHIDIDFGTCTKMSGLYVNEDELRNLDLEKKKIEFIQKHSKCLESDNEQLNNNVLFHRTNENINLSMQKESKNNPEDKNNCSCISSSNNKNNNDNITAYNEVKNNESINMQIKNIQVSDMHVNNDGDKDKINYYDNINDDDTDSKMNNAKSVGDYNSVSCEDLLEFSDIKPKGYERGVDSDEVRIMLKVLGKDVSPERCLRTLEFIEWDVHRAIKIIRLQNILSSIDLSLKETIASLIKYDWDVQVTALKLKNMK